MFLPQVDAAAADVGMPAENVVLIDGSPDRAPRPDQPAIAADHRRARAGAGPRPEHPPGRAALLLRHHRPGQGSDADPPQPGREHRAGRPGDRGDPTGPDPGRSAVLSHLRDERADERRALYRRAPIITMPKFDLAEFLRIIAELTPPTCTSPRRSRSRWPSIRSSTAYDTSSIRIIFSGAAPLDEDLGPGGGRSARLHRPAGLRDERDEPGQPHHSRGSRRHPARHSGCHAAQHEVQDRRSGHRRGDRGAGQRRQRAGRTVVQGSERDGRLPGRRGGHRRHPGRRRLPAHR